MYLKKFLFLVILFTNSNFFAQEKKFDIRTIKKRKIAL